MQTIRVKLSQLRATKDGLPGSKISCDGYTESSERLSLALQLLSMRTTSSTLIATSLSAAPTKTKPNLFETASKDTASLVDKASVTLSLRNCLNLKS